MPASQVVFTGVDAFVAAVTGKKTVQFSTKEDSFSPLIAVDLDKNPSNVPPSSWATGVDVDETLTTIGPEFYSGEFRGGVYLAQRLVAQNPQAMSGWPGAPDDIYQYQLVVRSNNGQITRFHGFKARVVGNTTGSIARLQFINIGTSAPSARWRWIDLNDPAVVDPPANGFTTIAPNTPAGTVGAVFINMDVVNEGGAGARTKYPRGLGG